MVDDSRLSRKNKKVAGIDDPIVVVQRILNVFRQLHILDEQQKKDFDNMILQQPPEIRHMCSVLPGGSLLQEYVDELEESNGIAPDQVVNESILNTEGKENILAQALADEEHATPRTENVTIKNNDNQPAIADNAAATEIQMQMLQMIKELRKGTTISATPAISVDGNLGKEIAEAISTALSTSNKTHHEETKELLQSLTSSQMQMTKQLVAEIANSNQERSAMGIAPMAAPSPIIAESGGIKIIDNTAEITRAITESQLQMAKMFLQQNAVSASNSSSNNANNIQINNTPMPANSQELVADIIKAQGAMFREMSKEQTKELSVLISGALKESNQLSNKSLTEALGAFHKENLKFWERQDKSSSKHQYIMATPQTYNGNNACQTASTIDEPEVVYEDEEVKTPDTTPVAEVASSYIHKVFGNVFNRGQAKDEATHFKPEIEVSIEKEIELAQDVAIQTGNLQADENEFEINSDGLGLSNIQAPKKKKKKKKKKNSINNLNFSNENTIDNAVSSEESDDDGDDISTFFDENSENQSLDVSNVNTPTPLQEFELDASLFDIDSDNPESILSDEPQTTPSITESLPKLDLSLLNQETDFHTFREKPTQNTESFIEEEYVLKDLTPENEKIEPQSDDFVAQSDVETKIGEVELYSEQEALKEVSPLYKSKLIPDLNDQQVVDNLLTENGNSFDDNIPLNLNAEYEFNNVSATSETTINESDEWKWEYEEDTRSNNVEVVAQPQAEVVLSEDTEWEWEYEEDTTDTNNAEVIAQPETISNEDGDWEWEYEEDTTDTNNAEVIAQPETISNEDGDWEWEYEEDTTDTNSAEVISTQSETISNEDGDWEWEYEETEELSSTTDSINNEAKLENRELLSEVSTDNDIDFSDLFDSFTGEEKGSESDDNFSELDPYSGKQELQQIEDLGLNSLQSGSLYFQEDIINPKTTAKADRPIIPASLDDDLVIDFSDDDGKNEPYTLNIAIKP